MDCFYKRLSAGRIYGECGAWRIHEPSPVIRTLCPVVDMARYSSVPALLEPQEGLKGEGTMEIV